MEKGKETLFSERAFAWKLHFLPETVSDGRKTNPNMKEAFIEIKIFA